MRSVLPKVMIPTAKSLAVLASRLSLVWSIIQSLIHPQPAPIPVPVAREPHDPRRHG